MKNKIREEPTQTNEKVGETKDEEKVIKTVNTEQR